MERRQLPLPEKFTPLREMPLDDYSCLPALHDHLTTMRAQGLQDNIGFVVLRVFDRKTKKFHNVEIDVNDLHWHTDGSDKCGFHAHISNRWYSRHFQGAFALLKAVVGIDTPSDIVEYARTGMLVMIDFDAPRVYVGWSTYADRMNRPPHVHIRK